MKITKTFLGFLFATLVVCNVKGQTTDIDSLIKSFKSLSDQENEYEMEFVENKNTFLLKSKTADSKELFYKAILTDIHPEGIFIFESDNNYFLRILSIDNGSRFIKERFPNGFRRSNTTNIIDIKLSKTGDFGNVRQVIATFKNFLQEPKTENDDIQIIDFNSFNKN